MPVTQRQLAASIQAAVHLADRDPIAAFVRDEATRFSSYNPFACTHVGSQRQIWTGQSVEFRALAIASLGLPCLMRALHELPTDEPLVQEILQAGPCRAYVYHQGDGCRIVGAILHGKTGLALPVIPTRARSQRRRTSAWAQGQLDLFVIPLQPRGLEAAYAGRTSAEMRP